MGTKENADAGARSASVAEAFSWVIFRSPKNLFVKLIVQWMIARYSLLAAHYSLLAVM